MPLFIDLPQDHVTTANFQIVGWVATDADLSTLAVLVNGVRVEHHLMARPDLRSVPELAALTTTAAVVAQGRLPAHGSPPAVTIELCCGTEHHAREVPVAFDAVPEDAIQAALRKAAWDFIETRLLCPSCRSPDSAFARVEGDLQCLMCQAVLPQATRAINMIRPDLVAGSDLATTENVSSNPYTHDALALIDAVVGGGGWVLDCGAGCRPERRANVINLEIVDYASTDVLGVGEALPFLDDSFDAVLSLAVLEHVRDPMLCAREIMRVLKPGGMVRADVPFLQPLHGFPNHYYNMTQAGLANLFDDSGDVLECKVPLHGHPLAGLRWMLSEYLAGLPESARGPFAAMTAGELAGLDPVGFVTSDHPAAAPLTPQSQAVIGCLNSILVRKR
jgi:SAM-dependent methyltransferase